MGNPREKTNSITHLVKIVANEVFDERMKDHLSFESVAEGLLGSIKNSLREAGQFWTADEDNLLIEEVRVAVAQIAANHKRSVGAIRSRIAQKCFADGRKIL